MKELFESEGAEGCFARNYFPIEKYIDYHAFPEETIKGYTLEEVELALEHSIESMLVARYTEKDIVQTCMNLHVGLCSRNKVRRLIKDIYYSEHYAMMDALINHSDGYNYSEIF